MHFPNAVSIVVSGPLFHAMRHLGTLSLDAVVTVVLIRIDVTAWQGKAMDMRFQGLRLSILGDP
jgi:hypothetical protein